jgi:peptide/nickel transport system substrate-binding protein
MSCYNSSVENYGEAEYAYNLEKAKALLEDAGWVDTNGDGTVDKDGRELVLELFSPTDRPLLKRVGPLIKDHLSKVGIRVDIKEFAYSYIREKTNAWEFDLALRLYSWSAPGGIIPYIVHSEYANLTYSNPEVDHLMETAIETADETERTELWSRVQLILLEDLPLVPLFVSKEYTAVRSEVEDLIVLPPYGQLIINDVKIRKEG